MCAVEAWKHKKESQVASGWVVLRYLFREKVILASRCHAWQRSASQSSSGDHCTASTGLKQPEYKWGFNHLVTFFSWSVLDLYCGKLTESQNSFLLRFFSHCESWNAEIMTFFFGGVVVVGWGRWVPELSGQNVPHHICAGLTFLHDAAFTDIQEGLHFVSVCFFSPTQWWWQIHVE